MKNQILSQFADAMYIKGYKLEGHLVPDVFSSDKELHTLGFDVRGVHDFSSLPEGFDFAPFEKTVRGPVTFITKHYDSDLFANEVDFCQAVCDDLADLVLWVKSLPTASKAKQ